MALRSERFLISRSDLLLTTLLTIKRYKWLVWLTYRIVALFTKQYLVDSGTFLDWVSLDIRRVNENLLGVLAFRITPCY